MGAARKYLLYAVGEITLVAIGILIALQINNWNEWRKDRILEFNYLKELQSDLKRDRILLNQVFKDVRQKLINYTSIDTQYVLRFQEDIGPMPKPERSFTFSSLILAPRPFRPSTGSYSSIITEGQSSLIKNRLLLADLDGFYFLLNFNAWRLKKVSEQTKILIDNIDQELGKSES